MLLLLLVESKENLIGACVRVHIYMRKMHPFYVLKVIQNVS